MYMYVGTHKVAFIERWLPQSDPSIEVPLYSHFWDDPATVGGRAALDLTRLFLLALLKKTNKQTNKQRSRCVPNWKV